MAVKAGISDEVRKTLGEYSLRVIRETNNAQDKVAKEAVQKLKNTSPKRTGRGKHYANGWAIKRAKPKVAGIVQVTVYNKSKPQLTHLLEHGHMIRNGKGGYGRSPAHPHIGPVEEWATEEVVREIERNLT